MTDLLERSIESWGHFVVQSSKNQKKNNNHFYLKSLFRVKDMTWTFHLQQFFRHAMIIFRIMITGAYSVCCNVFAWLFGSYWQYWCNRGPVLGLQRLNQRKENGTCVVRQLIAILVFLLILDALCFVCTIYSTLKKVTLAC